MARLDVSEIFHGILFPGHLHTQDSLQLALKFQFQDTDVLIVSYPKSGTTWMQEMLTLIFSRGDPHLSQTIPNWTRAPWLEHYYCADLLKTSTAAPRVLTTHLPYHLLGPTLQDSKAKIIYVSRNPKDVLVSFYHFHKMANFLPDVGSFPEFLNQFLDGALHFGSWFDHIEGWTSQAAALNLLHITYEEMSLDLQGTIKRLSSFLQCPLLEEELNDCVRHCSFGCMKDNKMINYTLIPDEILDHSKGCFMRKGEIGDWKNMLTEEQNQYFDSVFKSKMQNSTLTFVWEKPTKDESEMKQ
ncbi:PREDICTED: sulfotransferase family cytosolic 2B member 1-like [Cyprinodon variegatus]|uniref:Sulfotransferase n=1 Tax=Cyprinodon variegatus TaxID=28743 RepID=A0A3Q2E8R5_CYPVA|nr:PREDICTED: sulfotransferase family cytosolic 2B member 1-like [Cyprinodon variegatus]